MIFCRYSLLILICVQPVSYTHLDVYKRQVPILSREEEITKILERAGWFIGRQADTEEFEQYCHGQKLDLFPAALAFLREYNGLTLSYATYYHSGYDISKRSNHLYDYIHAPDPSRRKYMLIPTLDLTHPHISEFNRILIFSEESCVAVGEFGYYHSLLTIGRSGTCLLYTSAFRICYDDLRFADCIHPQD